MNELKFWKTKIVKFLKWVGPLPNPWLGGLRLVAISFCTGLLAVLITSNIGIAFIIYISTAITLIVGAIWIQHRELNDE